jgi:hydroxymethylpyrimidine pyrophosphatase-like HAD family hydrolase
VKKECIIVDLDGTLAHAKHRNIYDLSRVKTDVIDEPVRRVVQAFADLKVFIVSGRDARCITDTFEFLQEHRVPFDYLFMRKNNDRRSDVIVKQEIYEQNIKGQYPVLFVIDDRPKVCRMWREQGLKVLQVGDPHVEF